MLHFVPLPSQKESCTATRLNIISSLLLTLADGTYFSSSVGASIKHSPVPAKLSQKQRKILAMANKEASVEPTASKPTPTVTPSKSNGKAWWVTSTHNCQEITCWFLLLELHQQQIKWVVFLNDWVAWNDKPKENYYPTASIFLSFFFASNFTAIFHSYSSHQSIGLLVALMRSQYCMHKLHKKIKWECHLIYNSTSIRSDQPVFLRVYIMFVLVTNFCMYQVVIVWSDAVIAGRKPCTSTRVLKHDPVC